MLQYEKCAFTPIESTKASDIVGVSLPVWRAVPIVIVVLCEAIDVFGTLAVIFTEDREVLPLYESVTAVLGVVTDEVESAVAPDASLEDNAMGVVYGSLPTKQYL